MNLQEVLDTMEEKMMKTFEVVHNEFATVRTGKASPALVENIQVEAYDTHMRLRELAGISTPEPRLIVIQPWDPTVVQAVIKAIQQSPLGVTPVVDGKIIRLPIPELSEEARRATAAPSGAGTAPAAPTTRGERAAPGEPKAGPKDVEDLGPRPSFK